LTNTSDILGNGLAGSRVLVTGSSGFVGPYLIRRLLELGATVYGIDRRKSRSVDTLERIGEFNPERLTLLSGDLVDISSIANAVDKSQPDFVLHLASQSYIPESFVNPVSTFSTNALGTANLLEAIRLKSLNPRIVFAGSSEEYGLVVYSENQWSKVCNKYGLVFPEPKSIPELPIRETNPLRPMSPYAVSKVAADHLMRGYYHTYGLKTVVSRAFNHEGAGRGDQFVTSVITRQVMQVLYKERESIAIGDVTSFRDWSHVTDIVDGYLLLALRGSCGDVYNQGSQRTNSVLSFILLSLEAAHYKVKSIRLHDGSAIVDNPCDMEDAQYFGLQMPLTKVDRMLLDEELSIGLENRGFSVETEKGRTDIVFEPSRFRPSDVPILLSETSKIRGLGLAPRYDLRSIIADQINYYMNPARRMVS